jgi:hypothetical protein
MDNQEERKPHPKESLRRHQRRREILLIGRDGKTAQANYLKIVVPLLAGILIVSLVATILFAKHAADRREETAGLIKEVGQLKQQLQSSREEVEVMMARLIKAGEPVASEADDPAEFPREAVEPAVQKDAEPIHDEPSEAPGKTPSPVVSSEKFSLVYNGREKVLRTSFIVRNKLRGAKSVSGYAFVVLKPNATDRTGWAILPAVKTADNGYPARVERGHFFDIARYRTLKFTKPQVTPEERYSQATVWVFDTKGTIIYEQDYPIDSGVWKDAGNN